MRNITVEGRSALARERRSWGPAAGANSHVGRLLAGPGNEESRDN